MFLYVRFYPLKVFFIDRYMSRYHALTSVPLYWLVFISCVVFLVLSAIFLSQFLIFLMEKSFFLPLEFSFSFGNSSHSLCGLNRYYNLMFPFLHIGQVSPDHIYYKSCWNKE